MQESFYDIHGVSLRVAADGRAISPAIQTLLRHFQRTELAAPADLELRFQCVGEGEEIPEDLPSTARFLASQHAEAADDGTPEWRMDLYQDRARRIAEFPGQGRLVLDARQGRADAYFIESETALPRARLHCAYFAVTEMLRRRGLCNVHAAALEKGGRGVLIPGNSGRGKTTCCISLLRGGFRCLSDDHPFVREDGAALELLSFPVKVDVTDATVEFFPELRAASDRLRPGVRKRSFFVEEIYPDAVADACEPAMILLPQVVDCPRSTLEPLPKTRALEEILRQGLRVWDPELARQEFARFSRVVANAACYRLYFGEDVMDLPRLIEPLLCA